MPHHVSVAAFVFALMSVGCNTPSATHDSAAPSSASKATPEAAAAPSDKLPPPKTKMSLQQKSTKAFPMAGGKFFYEVADQWVFQPAENDNSLICVGDGEHCITLLKLKEQLNRPANDPLGIR